MGVGVRGMEPQFHGYDDDDEFISIIRGSHGCDDDYYIKDGTWEDAVDFERAWLNE